jgi:transposase
MVRSKMNKKRFCVGIDVGKDELMVAVVGRKPIVFGTSQSDVKRLVKWVKSQAGSQVIHIGMEATGVYSSRIALPLSEDPALTVSVINPAQIKAYGRATMRRTKTDRIDAQLICDFVVTQSPVAWTPPSAVQQALAVLVAQADAIQEEMRRWLNRRHAHQQMLHPPRTVTASTDQILRALQKQQDAVEKAINQLCQTDSSLAEDLAIAVSIPGIGLRSAVRMLAYGGSALTQRTRRQLDAHAGLAPAQRQSGTSVHGKSHIAKQGNARLRKSLYMPALVGVRHNPHLKRHYDRLVERGKLKKVALTACMRKLLNLLRAMLIKRTLYNPNYQPLT